MPYGTLIAWSALALFPFWAFLFIQQIDKLLPSLWRHMAMRTNRIALLLGIFWGIICYFLAENWAFSFSSALSHQDERAQTFWVVTAIIPILTLVSLLATAIGIGVYVSKREKKKD